MWWHASNGGQKFTTHFFFFHFFSSNFQNNNLIFYYTFSEIISMIPNISCEWKWKKSSLESEMFRIIDMISGKIQNKMNVSQKNNWYKFHWRQGFFFSSQSNLHHLFIHPNLTVEQGSTAHYVKLMFNCLTISFWIWNSFVFLS